MQNMRERFHAKLSGDFEKRRVRREVNVKPPKPDLPTVDLKPWEKFKNVSKKEGNNSQLLGARVHKRAYLPPTFLLLSRVQGSYNK